MSEVLTRECTEVKNSKVYGYCGDYIFEIIRKTGNFYEIGTLEKWTPYIGNVDVVFDVGANLGNHTLYWERTLDVKRIFSFEPYEPNYENLVRNIRANHLEGKVFPIMKAVGEHDGMASIMSVDQSNLGGTTFQYANEESDRNAEIVSLDGFVRKNSIESIGLIKIDTEGFEIGVLKGAQDTLKEKRPIVWVEVSSESHEQVREILERLQYDLADVEAFNMLFIPREKNTKKLSLSKEKLLDTMLAYKTKVNLYYNNSERYKSRYEKIRKEAETLSAEGEKLRGQLIISEKNYQLALKQSQEDQKKNEALKATNEQLTKKLEITEQNYQNAKKWNQASQEKNERLTEQIKAAEQKYKEEKEHNHIQAVRIVQLESRLDDEQKKTACLCEQIDRYDTIVEQNAGCNGKEIEKPDALVKCLERNKQIEENYAMMVARFVDQSKESEAFIYDITQHINKLQARVNYLKNENKEYRMKLDKITGVWYGRLGIKIYKSFNRLQASLRDKSKR